MDRTTNTTSIFNIINASPASASLAGRDKKHYRNEVSQHTVQGIQDACTVGGGTQAPPNAWKVCSPRAASLQEVLSRSVRGRVRAIMVIRSSREWWMACGVVASARGLGVARGRMRRAFSITCGIRTATRRPRVDGRPPSFGKIVRTN